MHELALLLAKLTPEEMIIEQMDEALTTFKLTGSEEAKSKLGSICFLFITKQSIGDNDIFKMSKEIDEMKRIKERMAPEQS